MSYIKTLRLQNYKGIDDVTIELDGRADCPVITLIGLNESGKTTILEGLSHFVSGDSSISGLFNGVHAKASGTGLIPIHKKAAFTGTIEIEGLIELTPNEVDEISSFAKKRFKQDINIEYFKQPFTVCKRFTFEDSVLKDSKNFWHFKLEVKSGKSGKYKTYSRPDENEKDLWLAIVRHVQQTLPQISYFPTFLVDMPSRIYLKAYERESAVNRQYRLVFQDILDSLKEDLSLERHVSDRISSFKEQEKITNWLAPFFGSPIKSLIDSVFQKISNSVTREVLGSWQRVFQRTISAKNILIEWNIDTEKDDLPYASFLVSDGESRYAISERSLGFRWFFSFLLFTAFKRSKSRASIFIFDEPAANLHAKAQAELLTSFSKIATEENKIIYSTHSHHMINPQWLSGAYIVENTALDYDTSDSFGLSTKPTKIVITKYRDFVSQYPTRSSYFQPVIEKLEYVSPEIIGEAPFVLIEGISDYYALKLAARIGKLKLRYRLLPGVGAGACGPLISLLMGRGDQFVILLDDDKAGKKEANRYKDNWFLPAEIVITLAAVGPEFKDKQIEGLITPDTLSIIQQRLNSTEPPSKKQIGWYLAEMCANEIDKNCLSDSTYKNLETILLFLDKKFAQ
ncbi:AAA family ATPase [Herbaspirillum huttiense]|uniref:AAA family ATPase n=1 Tax=Herbaspirillum huttiense TaxID=863372 RepID=UPI0038018124